MIKKYFYRLFPPSKHPEDKRPYTNKAIKKAFKIGGIQYYEFKQPVDMPWQRYLQLEQFILESNIKIDLKSLGEYLQIQREAINKGDLNTVAIVNNDIQRRIDMILNTNLMYVVFSCVFFNLEDGEDLTNYDYDFNDEKIKIFKSEDIGSFFFNQPISRFLPPLDFSKQDLQTLLKMSQMEEIRLQNQIKKSKSKRVTRESQPGNIVDMT